jgi:DNA topoisomerase-1
MATRNTATQKGRTADDGPTLVIVESPTKARTLGKFLGKPFIVEASVGHVRDLVEKKSEVPKNHRHHGKPWAGYGVNIENHFEPLEEIYIVPDRKKQQIADLKKELKRAQRLYLATDDDREGESISWHLKEVLELDAKMPVERLVFHEITQEAIEDALKHPRPIDDNLVVAQRARRVIDRLYGWDVSDVLRRKLIVGNEERSALSAGRVQSVALRMLVQRERERMAFKVSTWWDLTARFRKPDDAGDGFQAGLVRVGERRVAEGRDFDDITGALKDPAVLLLDAAAAGALAERLRDRPAKVAAVQVRPQTLRPYAPFTTSTLQQEANRKLRFSARHTMSTAQQLYESGFITYMRTDSTTLSEQALAAARELIDQQYGPEFLPKQPRRYQTKTANAQEAHEAIRPAGTHFQPIKTVEAAMGRDAGRLYELIWKRTVASQMVDAQVDQTTVDIAVDDVLFRATGRVTRFAGFLMAYVEGSDDPDQALDARDRPLPALKQGEQLAWAEPPIAPERHETRPPARLTDASLVKALEEKGIGRPSTYAAILQKLEDRYTTRRGQALVPTFLAMAVVRVLENHMPHLVDYGFTAEMESELDAIARGELKPSTYLRRFYEDGLQLNGEVGRVPGLKPLVGQVRDRIDPAEACRVPIGQTEDGTAVDVRIGRYGAFLKLGDKTANVPNELAPDEMTVVKALELIEARQKGDAPFGEDPATGERIFLRNGRFGWYLQRGVASAEEGAEKPKMVSLSKGMDPQTLDLATALAQLTLPRTLGEMAGKGPVIAKTGRFGDYVDCNGETRSLPPGRLAAQVTLDEAVALLSKPKAGQRGLLRELGPHDGKMVAVWQGRFGPYVTDGATNRTIPRGVDPDAVTLAQALEWLANTATARAGKVLGQDPDTGAEVRLIDGRFGPYLTNGAVNASLARGTPADAMTLESALDRLRHFGKPVKQKGRRGKGKATATKVAAPAKTPAKAHKKPKAPGPSKVEVVTKAVKKVGEPTPAATPARKPVVRRAGGRPGAKA